VAFRKHPPTNIVEEALNNTLLFSDALTLNEDEQLYSVRKEDLNGNFEYVVVAQQYGTNLLEDWRVVGVYTTSGDVEQHSQIDLGAGRYVDKVDIKVDFVNLPPQPF